VPATKSVGLYSYIRQAKTDDCPDWQSSNVFTVEVKNKTADGVCLGGVMWAKYNVDEPGSFTTSLEALGKVYRFNIKIPYPGSGTCTWDYPTGHNGTYWEADNDPCPPGWSVPTTSQAYKMFPLLKYRSTVTGSDGTKYNIACPSAPCSSSSFERGAAIAIDSRIRMSASSAGPGNYIWLRDITAFGFWTNTSWWSAPASYAVSVRCVESDL
jgi:hypothetical protein